MVSTLLSPDLSPECYQTGTLWDKRGENCYEAIILTVDGELYVSFLHVVPISRAKV